MLGVLVLGLLLAMVPKTMQLPMNHRLNHVLKRVNDVNGPFIGIIMSTASDEKLFLESGSFVPNPIIPSVDIAGRTFNLGTFKGVPTVYVIALSPLAHVSATVQILLDNFFIEGIIDYGKAATVSKSVKLADVAVISKTAFTGAWTWKDYEGSDVNAAKQLPTLDIGDYNVPEAGENKLGSLQYNKIKKYTPKGSKKETFWYYIDPEWFKLASELKDMNLGSCIGRLCTKDKPSVVYGAKASSSDAYLQNAAYGEFLNKELSVATVDRKSAATVSTAVANGVKHIVFRAASNSPGVEYDSELSALAGINNLKVVSAFVELLANQPRSTFNNVLRLN